MSKRDEVVGRYVFVERGKFAGSIGYCDDEEGRFGIVYFGEPFIGDYELIPFRDLTRTPLTHLPTHKWIRENPGTARDMGVQP